jgi:hypothetical protein
MNGTTLNHTLLHAPAPQVVDSGKRSPLGKHAARRLAIIGGGLLCLALITGVAPRLSQRQRAAIDTKQLAVGRYTKRWQPFGWTHVAR